MNRIYLDNQASTPLDPQVAEAMSGTGYGNPHSGAHAVGWEAAAKVATARQRVAELMGADSDEIFFTSGATEANNLAILGLRKLALKGRKKIILSAIEHKSVIAACNHLSEEYGFELTVLPVTSEGFIDLNTLATELDVRTALCSIGYVNNEIGTIQNVYEISRLCKAAKVLFHCDAAQAPSAVDMSDIAGLCDLLSISAHKMHGPIGIGALYISRYCQPFIEPLLYGGGQQEGIRPGTLPPQLCVGLGVAAHQCQRRSGERTEVARLRDLFLAEIQNYGVRYTLNGPGLESRHPGNANICLEDIDAHQLIGMLQPWIAASTKSACNSGIIEPSHVLTAIGLSQEQSNSSIRFSLGNGNNETQVKDAAKMIADVIRECI